MTITFRSKKADGTWVDNALTPFTFPAGEAHIKIAEDFDSLDYVLHVADVRGHDPQDLFLLAMWNDAVSAHDAQVDTAVLMPYLPGARADRGRPFGAGVYAEFINNLLLGKIVTLDPHSPVMPGLLGNLDVYPVSHIIAREVGKARNLNIDHDYAGVIAPDKGAHGRAAAAAYGMHVPVYTASKTRDFETGKLTGFHMEDELPAEGNFLIVDDICDGGGTFIGLAEAIKATNPNVNLDLWVTHGVFSKGVEDLIDTFRTIHTTNSYPALPVDEAAMTVALNKGLLVVHDITPYLYESI